ncbi:MAG: SPOR domain-containing protein [Chromatiales bacterium]|nr:SPOR domain-containing protein [Chromatiales bacterium]
MTHYIIDRKTRQRYLYFCLFFITLSFGLGYTFGYLHETSKEDNLTVNSVKAVPLIDKPIATQITKLPSTSPSQKESLKKTTQDRKSKPAKTDALKKPLPSPIKSTSSENHKTALKLKTEKAQPVANTAPAKDNKQSTATLAAKPIDKKTSRFVIQVGLFSNKENAADFVAQLEKDGFKAFFEAFISTSGKEKYNVRIGPFADKNIAKDRMSYFQEQHEGAAYILTQK